MEHPRASIQWHRTADLLASLLDGAQRIEAMLPPSVDACGGQVLERLEQRLEDGAAVRWVLHDGHPRWDSGVLTTLHNLARRFSRTFFVQADNVPFEDLLMPSIMQQSRSTVAVVPVAGWQGSDDWSCAHRSILVEDTEGVLLRDTQAYLDAAIRVGALAPLENLSLDVLLQAAVLTSRLQRLQRWRPTDAMAELSGVARLSASLALLKSDPSARGFDQQRLARKQTMHAARQRMRELIQPRARAPGAFLGRHHHLIAQHVLTLLGDMAEPREGVVALSSDAVQAGLAALGEPRAIEPEAAFATLHSHFSASEAEETAIVALVLHILDPRRFARASLTALRGVALGLDEHGTRAENGPMTPHGYAEHCRRAERLRHALKLPDLADLHALLRYVCEAP